MIVRAVEDEPKVSRLRDFSQAFSAFCIAVIEVLLRASTVIGALLVAGAACAICAAVMLVGTAWALAVAAGICFALAWLLLRGAYRG